MGVGVQPMVTDYHLPLVGDMGRHPGDELQAVHPLELGALLTIPVTNFSLGFQKCQPLQGKHRPEHVFPHPLGLRLRLGPDQAVDVEAGVRPGEEALGPLRAQQLLADKIGQDLAGKDLSQPRVVDPGDLTEEAGLVHSALSHQEMEAGVEIDAVSEGLNGRDHPGH